MLFVYLFEGGEGEIVVVIIRFEIMFGDIVVVVYLEDLCYKYFYGKFVVYFFQNCRIFIICDDVLVDMVFGIGVVKVCYYIL